VAYDKFQMNLTHVMTKSKFGPIVISVILGLGLAALFKRVCHGEGCVVVQSPDTDELRTSTYRIGESCYKYTPHMTPCQLRSKTA